MIKKQKQPFDFALGNFCSGFTLIELSITISIIVIMAAVSIPAFSSYQRRSELVQKAEEINGLMVQLGVQVQNPERGVATYGLDMSKTGIPVGIGYLLNDTNSLVFYKIYESNPSVKITIKSFDYNPNYGLKIQSAGAYTSGISCLVKNKSCCVSDSSGSCLLSGNNGLKLYDTGINGPSGSGLQALILVKNDPYSVTETVGGWTP